MWNYSFVVPSLLVLIIFLGYYFLTPRIPINLNRMFLYLIGIESLVLLSDLLATWADSNYQSFSVASLYLFNSFYFIAFFVRAVFFFVFTSLILNFWAPRVSLIRKLILMIPTIITSVIVLLAPWTQWFYYIDGEGYHSGPLYNLIYVESVFYIFHSFCIIYAYRANFRNIRERNSTIFFNTCLLVGLIMRYSFPRYLLMDTFCLMAIIIIYLTFENPDFYLEGRTGLFNSNALRSYIREIHGKRKYKLFAVLIHNYSEIRDIYGMNQMDRGICLIGDYLKQIFPFQKVFYNRSGRFSILVEHNVDMDFRKMGNMIQDRFREPWKADDVEIYADVGSALLDVGENQDLTVEGISQLMIAAFALAGNSDGTTLPIVDEAYAEKTKWESEVKKALSYALENDGVEVFLQPIVDAKTRQITGAEALARIRDRNGNLILPGLFIPIAERNGKINKLGEIVFNKICEFIKENDITKYGLSWINLNLSPVQFMRPDLGDRLLDFVNKMQVDPRFIHLEITEENMVDEQLLEKQIDALRTNGFSFVLDDYGKGYSNMSRLRSCPFVNIKLDMSIVWDYCKAPDEMVPNMVKTFSGMGFEITAEGIEDEKMADAMEHIGCNYLQGYLYSKPVPMDEFVKLLKN